MQIIRTFASPNNEKNAMRWSEGCLTFSVGWEGPSCETEAFPERTSVMSKKITTTTPPTEKYNKEQGWNKNTELCVNLKTLLRSDKRMKVGKDYQGVLRRDVECEEFNYDDHFTFVETLPPTADKRNPHVYEGDYITITRRDDGSYRPNFKPMKVDKDFTVAKYATGVANELLWALEGLIKNG